ncbi:MAG: hypothetical protein FH748_03480 [Balneolaceae bacterium]|nr:hypothetical protein [Balneolaceae bacterium]
MKAFSKDIEDGLVRVLITINSIHCTVENDAPDFVDVEEDQPVLRVEMEDEQNNLNRVFEKIHPLVVADKKTKPPEYFFDLEEGGIWFDTEMEKVKDYWISEYNFYIESQKPRYLCYHIKNLEHKLQWLEQDNETGEIRILSEFKKKYVPPKITGTKEFKADEIMKCIDMISRAIQKIDLRSKGALVKFNTDRGRLESLIIGIADRLGYVVKVLEEEERREIERSGGNASHSIHLKE